MRRLSDNSCHRRIAGGANHEWSNQEGGQSRPRLRVRFFGLNRRRRCVTRLGGWTARVITTGLRFTMFNITFYVDGRFLDSLRSTRFDGGTVDTIRPRRGRHRLRVVVEDQAVRDRISRVFPFRIC